MANRIQFKRGTRAKIDNITLNTGEPAFSTDTEELFIKIFCKKTPPSLRWR